LDFICDYSILIKVILNFPNIRCLRQRQH